MGTYPDKPPGKGGRSSRQAPIYSWEDSTSSISISSSLKKQVLMPFSSEGWGVDILFFA
jgi:hypothetical protein